MSRKSSATLAHIRTTYVQLLMDMKTLGLNLDYDDHRALLASFVVRPSLVDQIRGKQMQDERLVKKVHKIMNGEIGENFSIAQDGVLTMKGRACVPDVDDLRKLIMEEAHCSAYAMHPGSTKMYRTIKENYLWFGMKKGCCRTSKGETLEASWNSLHFTYSRMEVGTYRHGRTS